MPSLVLAFSTVSVSCLVWFSHLSASTMSTNKPRTFHYAESCTYSFLNFYESVDNDGNHSLSKIIEVIGFKNYTYCILCCTVYNKKNGSIPTQKNSYLFIDVFLFAAQAENLSMRLESEKAEPRDT